MLTFLDLRFAGNEKRLTLQERNIPSLAAISDEEHNAVITL